jgi:lysozyme
MNISQRGLAALGFFEGLRLKAYRDGGGVWTIGVGHTAAAGPPTPVAGMVITHQQALDLLARDLPQYEAAVRKRLPIVPQNVFDGAVSFCFNVGVSGFRKASWPTKYLAGQMPSAEAALRSWNQDNHKIVAGLVTRRAEEADIIFRGLYPAQVLTSANKDTPPNRARKQRCRPPTIRRHRRQWFLRPPVALPRSWRARAVGIGG